MTDPDLVACLETIPLYADLTEEERADIVIALRRVSFGPGEELMHQGAAPDGAYFILSGGVRITAKLPGGAETQIGEFGAGSTLGELALIRSVPRTATVRAIDNVETVFVDRRVFCGALDQLRPGTFKVLRQLALLLSERLRVLHGRIREAVAGGEGAYESLPLPPEGPSEGGAPAGFDPSAFLPILPCFRGFHSEGIEALRQRAKIISPQSGHRLMTEGNANRNGYIVVRGAVASGFVEAGRMHLLNVLGPGCFCAVGALIEDSPLSAGYVVRENAVLLELPRDAFMELYQGTDQTALSLITSVNEHQANMVSRANNHLTRLVGLSRLSSQFERSAGVTV